MRGLHPYQSVSTNWWIYASEGRTHLNNRPSEGLAGIQVLPRTSVFQFTKHVIAFWCFYESLLDLKSYYIVILGIISIGGLCAHFRSKTWILFTSLWIMQNTEWSVHFYHCSVLLSSAVDIAAMAHVQIQASAVAKSTRDRRDGIGNPASCCSSPCWSQGEEEEIDCSPDHSFYKKNYKRNRLFASSLLKEKCYIGKMTLPVYCL